MAFDSLSERLNGALRNISGKGKLTDKNMPNFCDGINVLLYEDQTCVNKFKEALDLLKKALEHTGVERNDCQDEKLTKRLFRLAKSPNQTHSGAQINKPQINIVGKIDLTALDSKHRIIRKGK